MTRANGSYYSFSTPDDERRRRPTHEECRLCTTTDLGRLYWIYIIPADDTHQWLLLQFLVLLMMGAESVRNMKSVGCVLQPTLDVFTGYISSRLMTRTNGCYYSFSTPDDGRRKRPKHVESSRSC